MHFFYELILVGSFKLHDFQNHANEFKKQWFYAEYEEFIYIDSFFKAKLFILIQVCFSVLSNNNSENMQNLYSAWLIAVEAISQNKRR